MTRQIEAALLSPPVIEGDSSLAGKFHAMGSPCEILVDGHDLATSRRLLELSIQEAQRIEKKFSRYRKGNITDQIITSQGKRILVDQETSSLLDFANVCFELSDGLFDITTGVLRKVWRFDRKPQTIQEQEIKKLLPFVGWKKLRWERPFFQLPTGMEIDLGGICKEYAADRILDLLIKTCPMDILVNLGGDIAVKGQRRWSVGIEDVKGIGKVAQTININQGGLATSGNTKRFALINGNRLGHILNPISGWPVANPPQSVTVAASTCTEAGFFSTLAMLYGAQAETFLIKQNVKFWCYR